MGREKYEIGELLGSGNFSKVYKAKRKADGTEWAIKVIEKGGADKERLNTEISILKKVSHPSIILLEDVFEEGNKIYLVMERVYGGELFNKIVEIGSYSEDKACELVKQILEAIQYLHANNIVHRDLKPTNLLLKSGDSERIKIADFGLSKIVGPDMAMQTACGTPIYVAPEVLSGEGYDKSVDIWSVGVIMYIMLCGFPPFFDEDENMGELFEQIMTGDFDFPSPYWDDISDDAQDLVEKMLVVEPAKRFTAEQCLKHPWFTSAKKKTAALPNVKEKILKTKK